MKNHPLISVVMLNYNRLKYLKQTIKPILNQDYPNFEFMIVDNGSDDGSIKYIKKFKKIKLIENKENLGYSKGKNIGIRKAKGKYILLLDEDILIRNKDILNKLLQNYSKNMGFLQITLVDNKKNKTKYYGISYSKYGINSHKKEINIEKILNSGEKLIEIGSPTGACIFSSKFIWEKIGLFDESQKFNIDDVDIGARSSIFGFKNYLYTKDYLTHLGINNRKNLEIYSKRFKLIFSGHGRSMVKNYRLKNLILRFPIFFAFQLIKAIRYSIKKRSPKIFFAYLYSVKFFIKNLPDTLKQRKIIQSKRVIKEDIFLKIKPPKFD